MSKLFGVPVDSLALVLTTLLLLVLAGVAVLALRNRVFFRLGVRNVRRRPARSALIVAGSMLGTAIIAAALATGDTMSHTIRSAAVAALGRTDEVVAARGIQAELSNQTGGGSTSARYFPESYADRIARAAGPGLVDGAAPVIAEAVAVQDVTSRQNEPQITLFASDPARLRAFGRMTSDGETVSLAALGAREVYLNEDAAHSLDAKAGDTIRVLAGSSALTARVKAVVSYRGAATPDEGVLMRLGQAQRLLGKPGLVRGVFVANHGGVAETDRVLRALRPTLAPLGLEADDTKRETLDAADTAGASFMSLFTTFGSFSIAAGILLIFLIFVMLAAERRSELGIARAVGTRRGHLVQMFLYEGVAYDVLAAAAGALLGLAVAYGMVLVMAGAFASTADVRITYFVSGTSLVVAYAIGVLLTLIVVAFSAWRVSRMNIVSAIRDLPEPAIRKQRRRRLLGLVGIVLGLLLVFSGADSKEAVVLGLGVLLVVLSLVPVVRGLGPSDRVVYTTAGLVLVLWFTLPINRWLIGEMKVNFSIFLLGGLAIVVGASWVIVYNADVLLGALAVTLGRIRRLAPVLRMSMAYPLRSLFRTGVTLAMFTLVVFTLVVGAITTGSFVNAFNDLNSFGGGFDVRATTSPGSPIPDLRAALGKAPGVDASSFRVVSSQSVLPVKARQVGDRTSADAVVHGADAAFLRTTTYRLAARAKGYGTDAAVWRALRERRNLAVIDALAVPRRANWSFGQVSELKVHGFYLEDKTFAPFRVVVRDQQTGRQLRLTVVGVLSDSAPPMVAGLWTSQRTLAAAFGDRVQPTVHLFALKPGVDPKATARKLESAFLANGMEADSLKALLDDSVAASLTFDRLIMGFMGLGLIVGVAALGVISARSVVERRQQIGVLRAIGFRRGMVQLSFLLESSFLALTSIVVGTGLGLAVAFSVVSDSRRTPSWEGMAFEVPWLTLLIIFGVVYAVALATTWAPARRASRVYPAEALRYQ